jgi:hypothetical protein
MNWRTWLKETLSEDTQLTELVPADSIIGAGGLEGVPTPPFIVINLGPQDVVFNEADMPEITEYTASIWAHDRPGSYDFIDSVLFEIQIALVGQVADEGICRWQGDSGELADDVLKTITRNSNYLLIGRKS